MGQLDRKQRITLMKIIKGDPEGCCPQREVQALRMLTYMERDDCLINNLSMWPTVTTGRNDPL